MATNVTGTDKNVYGPGRHLNRGLKLLRSTGGFTMAELTVAFGIFAIMSLGTFLFTSMFMDMRHEYSTHGALTGQARTTMDRMIWGVHEGGFADRYGIWEAQALTIVSATEINYTDTNGNTHGIRLNGHNIEKNTNGGLWTTLYDPNGAAADDPATYQTTLSFQATGIPDVMQIQLIVGERLVGRWHYASLSTQVHYRN